MHDRSLFLCCCLATLLMVITGCGWNVDNALGDHTTTTTTTTTTSGVTITPSTVSMAGGGTSNFSATVSGATGQGVIWSVVESNGGSITQGGVYTAPQTAGTYHVTATSAADPGNYATATVTVTGGMFPQVWKSDTGIVPAVTMTITGPALDNIHYLGTIQCSVLPGGLVTIVDSSGLNYILPFGTGGYKFQAQSPVGDSMVAGSLSPVTGNQNQLSGTLAILDGTVSPVSPVYSSTSALFTRN
ncbi:hypothetical protein [Geobacter argillaceus]|uniref:Ig-like domain-containing protein n=1 Tax=Geobacter argillaceus TaxID=345631 RepID=A0A562WRP6_9BACT|nr:hypothetical protein [Geobacter argillaceus]TWJ32816.1 hypothetical protein JN12_00793 [Geobacter argillaceus]